MQPPLQADVREGAPSTSLRTGYNTFATANPSRGGRGRVCSPEFAGVSVTSVLPKGQVELLAAESIIVSCHGSPMIMTTQATDKPMNDPANPNKALWEKGDFTRIADTMRESGETLVQKLGITKEMKVLDLGCGDGTTAVPAAKLGADVQGIDIARNLVEAGNKRAAEHGLTNLKFQEGDASNLEQVPDKSFDVVVSIFGAMFAPKPFDVAKEMVRVTRPGGRIVMGNWIPNDPTLVAQILKISSNYTPPPPEGFVSPMTWGVEGSVIERFTVAGVPKENISFKRDTFVFNFSGTPAEFVDAFRKYYGPTMNAFEAAEKQGKAGELQKQLEELFESQNNAARGQAGSKSATGTSIPATFLRVTVERK